MIDVERLALKECLMNLTVVDLKRLVGLRRLHSIHPDFPIIKDLMMYSPRLNKVFHIGITDIPQDVIDDVKSEIFGY